VAAVAGDGAEGALKGAVDLSASGGHHRAWDFLSIDNMVYTIGRSTKTIIQ